ncbi:MAG: plasmid pRiA4b ORF-3 family protein [Candidatus Binatia bacterium]
MPTKKPTSETQIYQLKITLKDFRPAIWRQVHVASTMSLETLHGVIQLAMGWTNSHMHQFKVGKTYYGTTYPDDFDGTTTTKDEGKVTVGEVLKKPKAKLVYEYDFGDGWEHEVVLEKILSPEAGVAYPRCISGQRACPPEDCGGVWGYANLLEALQDPEHPEHEELSEWLGDNFDPEAFAPERVNRALRRIR